MSEIIAGMILALVVATPVAAVGDLTPPPARDDGGAVPISVLVYVLDLDEVDSSQQTFTANVFLRFEWDDPRLVHEGPGPIHVGLNDIWQPRFQVLNQQKVWKTFPEVLEVAPDGHVTYRQRVWGHFSQPLQLHDYPADEQVLSIELVSAGFGPDVIRLIPAPESKPGIAADLSIADFDVTGTGVFVGDFKPLASGRSMASYRADYIVQRKTGYFVVKVIIPLMLIVMMSWAVFWIDPAEAGTQIGVATTTMLTLIAFRFAIDTSLPKISYLTRLDTFVMASTVLVFLSLFEVVATSRLAKTGHHERAMAFDRWSRLLFPGAFVIVIVLAFT